VGRHNTSSYAKQRCCYPDVQLRCVAAVLGSLQALALRCRVALVDQTAECGQVHVDVFLRKIERFVLGVAVNLVTLREHPEKIRPFLRTYIAGLQSVLAYGRLLVLRYA
jgi:hypothetical protein